MVPDDSSRLTDRQRDCLRLVGQGLSSKEIAVELGISYHTVDLHLKRAIRALGVATRRDAARRLDDLGLANGAARPEQTSAQATATEGFSDPALSPGDTQPLDTQSPRLAEPASIAAITIPAGPDDRPTWRLPFLRQGRQYNDLEPVARILWIVALAVAMLLAAANFLNGLSAIHDLIT